MARADQLEQRTAPADSPQHARSLACFGVLSPYEVALDNRRKLIGFSQIRKRGVVLYQVGFYRYVSGHTLARHLPPITGMADELDERIASLSDVGVDPDALIEAIAARAPAA